MILPLSDAFLALNLCVLVIAIVAAVHAYRVASRWEDGRPRPGYSRWYAMAGIALAIAATTFLLRGLVMEPFKLPADSMAPSFPKGTYILVKKWGYGHYVSYGVTLMRTTPSATIARGDVVVFDYPIDPDKSFIKRVIGLPGDKVTYRDKRLSVNGTAVLTTASSFGGGSKRAGDTRRYQTEQLDDASYVVMLDDFMPPLRVSAVRNFPGRNGCVHDTSGFECNVPLGNYFVLGDNRDNSDDSRYWGFVPGPSLIGKVWHAFPPKK